MKGASPEYAEAVVVTDGKIGFVGALAEAKKAAGKRAKTIDLKGRTLLPGFIDTHGHMVYYEFRRPTGSDRRSGEDIDG